MGGEEKFECPWCGKLTTPKINEKSNNYGVVVERGCELCGKVLASYLKGEGQFLPQIRKFTNL